MADEGTTGVVRVVVMYVTSYTSIRVLSGNREDCSFRYLIYLPLLS